MDQEPIRDLYLFLAGLFAAAAVSLALCYLWGRLVGRTARRMHASQWRAYGAALFPFAVLTVSLILNHVLAGVSVRWFLALAAPALVGAFQRWHWGPEPAKPLMF